MGLGINKDLEPLVRRARRERWEVAVTRSNHVRWTGPDGTVLRSGLTMSSSTAHTFQRRLRRNLDAAHLSQRSAKAQAGPPR